MPTKPKQSADQQKAKNCVLVETEISKMAILNERPQILISSKFLEMSKKRCLIEGLNSYNLLTNNSVYK